MKILHVNDNYTAQGGVEQYILTVGRLLADHGHSNVIIYTEQPASTIRKGAWPAYHIQTGADIAAQVQKVLDVEQPDVAYIHHASSPALIELVGSILPAVAYVHGFTTVCPGLGKYFRRGDVICERPFGWGCVPMHYLRRCSAARNPRTLARLIRSTEALKQAVIKIPRFLVASKYMANLLVQNGFSAEKINILPPHFLPDNISLTYTPSDEGETILFAGRLEIEKGFPYLLQAFTLLPDTVKLKVAGDGTQRSNYEAAAKEIGVANRIKFLGWLDRDTLQQALDRCKLVVMPSIFPEPFGKTGIDAHTHGRPVVAFDAGGISEWLHEGANGFLVDPRNSRKFADRIDQLLHNEALRIEFGQDGQNGVVRQFAASQHLTILMATFEMVRHQYG
jgi:glycosyltransferase involved in cell wall biosynthesis